MQILNPKNEEAWLKLRHRNINSTESSALFGLSPYSSEFELWHRKKEDEPYVLEDNFRMKAGRVLEPAIAQLALDEIGCKGVAYKDYIQLPSRMGASFDWRVIDGEYKDWLIECKNVDFIQYNDKWTESEAPAHIESQVQHQMHVGDAPGAIIVALVGGNDLKLIFRSRDKKFGSALEERIKKFWHDFDNDIEPEPDFERDAKMIQELYGNATKDKFEDLTGDDDVHACIARYREVSAEIKELESIKDALKAKLFMRADDASKIICGKYTVSLGRVEESKGVLVTPDMVGTRINQRKGYRQLRTSEKKK